MSFLGGCAIGLLGVIVLGTAVVRPLTTDTDGDDSALMITSAPPWSAELEPPSSNAEYDPDDSSLGEVDPEPGSAPTTTITQVVAPTTLPPTIEAGASGVIGILDATDRSLIASGLVLDGMVISSAHALGERTSVLLSIGDETIGGLVDGTDPFSDLVVIATLEPDRLPAPITLDPSTAPSEREMGSPIWILSAGGQHTPNAIAGELTADDQEVMTSGGAMVFDALQTTIRTPTTGPGGAVVDQDGHTVGMVIACNRHLASALSIESLRASAQSIRETGWAHIGWLGIEGESTAAGIQLRSVEPDGPATAAGLLPGDVLRSVDGEPLEHIAGVVRAIRRAGVGNEVEFDVQRGSETFTATITVGARVG